MRWLPAMLLAGVFAFTACSDDEKNGDVFSSLTEEQHKEKIEQEGIAMVQEMDDLTNLQTYDVIDAFVDLMDQSETQQTKALEFSLNEVVSLKNGPKATLDFKAVTEVQKRISEEFAKETGIFKWNAEAGDWEKVDDSTTEATFRFMVEDKEAEISVYDVAFKDAAHQDAESDMVIELPTSIKAYVKYDNNIITSFSLSAEWNDDDTPKSIVEEVTLEAYSFSSELINTTSKVSASATLKHNEKVIYANGFILEGDFDYEKIEAILSDSEDDMNGLYGQTILENTNIWFQLGNIKIEGAFDIKGFMEDMADKAQSSTDESGDMEDMLIELFNNNATLIVRYADSQEIIAKGELYMAEYTNGDETDTEPAMRMVFGDGSKVSVDEFFENGFGDMGKEIEDLLEKLETSYGDEAA
jgi:hypothetical protein